ncbi:MAG: hypothetical protein A2X64_08290 [Ignavibacteria bacterium GWF2_33_9]|nr:MAG: hypothetical protein A2X64_08290 [Ignavibacteria bacterium GWF2_33_9]
MLSQDTITIKGIVILQKFSEGSKSEHDAIYLDTGTTKFRLKRRGGNPFYDEFLHSLVGKTVVLKGKITSHFFEITEVEEIL